MTSISKQLLRASRLPLALVLITVVSASAQQGSMGTGGASTGTPQKATYDAQHRPITAGGTVATGPIIFRDASQESGLTRWRHQMGTAAKKDIIETVGSGVALLDFDGDGWLDIYLVNGSTAQVLAGKAASPHAALFRNNHDGTFTDVAGKAGVQNDRWGFGVVVGDYNNDGLPDLYVSNFNGNRLYRNNGDGTFTDVAVQAGVAVSNWSTGATWGDYDRDGRLDLFVPGYVEVNAATLAAVSTSGETNTACAFRGVPVMCGPRGLRGAADHLFHNNGDGTFTDVSKKAGVADEGRYYGLASVFLDVNNDGLPDLLVANDSTPNYLYLNKGDGTFEDISFASGYALNEAGRETASMGIASGDFQHSGRLSIYNTTFSDDYNPLYRNDGDGNFTDVSYALDIAAATVPFLGWGDALFDYDNDGWLDLLVANGHVYPTVDTQSWGTSYAQRPLLFHNLAGKLQLAPAVEGTGLAAAVVGRGLAVGDLWNDGRMSAVINVMDGAPLLLKNVANTAGTHWLGLVLRGTGKSNRGAIGATVYVTVGGIKQRADVVAGGSYGSSSDQRIHFGLGTAGAVETIDVLWPDGRHETVKASGVDRYLDVIERVP